MSLQPFITNEELLTLLRENIHDLVAIIDSNRRRIWFNDAYSLTLGFARAELESGDSTSSLHPDDIQNVRDRFEEALATGTGKLLEYRMRHKDGSWVWLESRSRVIREVHNLGTCVVLVARNITERKLHEAAQQAHQRRLQAQKNALVELNHAEELHQNELATLTAKVASVARQTLNCEEVSVWWVEGHLLRHQGSTRSDAAWDQSTQVIELNAARRTALNQRSVLAVRHAPEDPLANNGPAPRPNSASLQITLHRAGVAAGLMICSDAQPNRHWHPDEESFADSLGAVLMQSLEARERRLAFAALELSQKQLAAELAEAAAYVQALLPERHEYYPHADWVFIPSTQLGGDAFGYHWIDPDHFAMYLLDVCGHGVGAALLSISALNVLRSSSLPGIDFRSPAAVMGGLNRTFDMDRQNQMYFTVWYGVWNRQTRMLSCSCGGHPPGLLFSTDGSALPARLGKSELVIGAMPEVKYTAETTFIPEGATLLIISDGVYEITRPDGTMWTVDEFCASAERDGIARGDTLNPVVETARKVRGGSVLEDDFSLVRVRF